MIERTVALVTGSFPRGQFSRQERSSVSRLASAADGSRAGFSTILAWNERVSRGGLLGTALPAERAANNSVQRRTACKRLPRRQSRGSL